LLHSVTSEPARSLLIILFPAGLPFLFKERGNLSFISAIEDMVWGSLIFLFSHNTRLNTIHIPDGEEEAFEKGYPPFSPALRGAATSFLRRDHLDPAYRISGDNWRITRSLPR
jgi:hypothetical protein